MRAYRVTLLSFVLSLLFIFSAQLSEQIYEIGKIIYIRKMFCISLSEFMESKYAR